MPDASPKPPPNLRYSVVVPVYNESETIGSFCRQARSMLPSDYELLICYDFDDDNTLPALAALPDDRKPARICLIRNCLGAGARYAIEAGMRAAHAPVVLVTMADLCDDFGSVGQMIAKAEEGADVVCASRYMPGGRQIGGPWLKGKLSWLAGASLYALGALPVRDPTNSFKAYRKSFLDQVTIETSAGFCLALELTVKAHCRGGRVEEVPTVWRDRTAGRSRFKLISWLPAYLRWYLRAIHERLLSCLVSRKRRCDH